MNAISEIHGWYMDERLKYLFATEPEGVITHRLKTIKLQRLYIKMLKKRDDYNKKKAKEDAKIRYAY